MARGPTPASERQSLAPYDFDLLSTLVKAMQSIQTPIPKAMVNPVSWTGSGVQATFGLGCTETRRGGGRLVEVWRQGGDHAST